MRYAIILNGKAGTIRMRDPGEVADALTAIAARHGIEVSVRVAAPKSVFPAVEAARDAADWDAVIVGGGDGTASRAAGLFAGTGKTLGILPLGTMNLFARSLGIPLPLEDALEALLSAETASVDICAVNGRPFVHHLALGLHPHLLQLRESMRFRSRLGKIVASFVSLFRALRRPPSLAISVALDGERRRYVTGALAVSNNLFAQGLGRLPYAETLRGGVLGVYIGVSSDPADMVRLAANAMLGAWHDNPLFEAHTAREVEISLAKRRVTASLDGELVKLPTPLRVVTLPGQLKVLKPRAAAPAQDAARDGAAAARM